MDMEPFGHSHIQRNFISGARPPQESVDVSHLPTDSLEKKPAAFNESSVMQDMKLPTTESVCVTKQQLLDLIEFLEVKPDPNKVSNKLHILPIEESVFVSRFLFSSATFIAYPASPSIDC